MNQNTTINALKERSKKWEKEEGQRYKMLKCQLTFSFFLITSGMRKFTSTFFIFFSYPHTSIKTNTIISPFASTIHPRKQIKHK